MDIIAGSGRASVVASSASADSSPSARRERALGRCCGAGIQSAGTTQRIRFAREHRPRVGSSLTANLSMAGPSTYREEIAQLGSLATPGPWTAKASLIATARIAVPRALELLAFAEENVTRYSLRDGSLRGEGALAIAGAMAVFDQHRASDGRGTGTV